MTEFRPLGSSRVLLLLVALVNIGLVVWWWLSPHVISHESGPIENLQVAVLFLALSFYFYNARALEGAGRSAAVIFCILCFYMIFREIDFRTFPVSDPVLSITTGRNRKIVQGIIFLILIGYVMSHFTNVRSLARAMTLWRAWPYYFSIILIIVSKLAEEFSRPSENAYWNLVIPHGEFWEELLELNAYMMLLLAGITFYEFGRFICDRDKRAAD